MILYGYQRGIIIFSFLTNLIKIWNKNLFLRKPKTAANSFIYSLYVRCVNVCCS